MTALAGVELESLVSEPDALTTAMLRLLYLTPKREADLTAPNDLIYK